MTKISLKHYFNLMFLLFCLVNFHAQNGTLDTTFGINGVATASNSGDSDLLKAVVETDSGKILAGGTTDFEFATLVSFNQDGSVNAAFGNNGILVLNFGGEREHIRDMVKQPDGKILVTSESRDNSNNYDIIVARINEDGSFDTGFGNNGIKTITFGPDNERSCTLDLQPDGKILVGGNTDGAILYKMAIARLLPNGALDNTFSNDGKQTLVINNRSEYFNDITTTFDGKIIGCGGTVLASGSSQGRMAIVRYLDNGELDTTFGNNGTVVLNVLSGSCIAESIISLSDGKSLISGYATGNDTDGTPYPFSFATIRLNIDGSLDSTFGHNGKVITVFPGGTSQIFKLKMTDNNQIYAAGRASLNGGAEDFAIAKYDYDGNLDMTFGTNGIVSTDVSGSFDRIRDFIIKPNKLIVAGFSMETTPDERFAVARYNIENSLSIAQNDIPKSFEITPNITDSIITLQSQSNVGNIDISIFDMNGKIVYTEKAVLDSNTRIIDLQQLSKGYYLLKVDTKDISETHKIILK